MRYIIEPLQKKSVHETEFYYNDAYQSTISVATCWRWGTYTIDVEDPSDLPKDTIINEEGIVLSSHNVVVTAYDWEFVDTTDAITVDIEVDRADGISATEEQYLDNFEVELEETTDYYELLHEDGWVQQDILIEIFGPVSLHAATFDDQER
jgi:hypothetical protein